MKEMDLEIIKTLSDLRARFNCFDGKEEPYYFALSRAIEALSAEPCEDAVSVREVQNVITLVADTYSQNTDALKVCGVISDRIANLPSATPAPKTGRWIEINTQKPKTNESVLVCDLDGDIYISHATNHGAFYSEIGDKIKDVRYWMPLPVPPCKEREEK